MTENLGVFLDNQKFQYSKSPIVGKSVGSDINSLGSDRSFLSASSTATQHWLRCRGKGTLITMLMEVLADPPY